MLVIFWGHYSTLTSAHRAQELWGPNCMGSSGPTGQRTLDMLRSLKAPLAALGSRWPVILGYFLPTMGYFRAAGYLAFQLYVRSYVVKGSARDAISLAGASIPRARRKIAWIPRHSSVCSTARVALRATRRSWILGTALFFLQPSYVLYEHSSPTAYTLMASTICKPKAR